MGTDNVFKSEMVKDGQTERHRHRERERERATETATETETETDRQTDRQTETERETERETEVRRRQMETDIHTAVHTDKQAGTKADRIRNTQIRQARRFKRGSQTIPSVNNNRSFLWNSSFRLLLCLFETGPQCPHPCCCYFYTELRVPQDIRLVGLVVKASAPRAEDPGFESRLRRDFSGSSHTSDLKTGTPVATLPSAGRFRVSAGTGRPGVSIL